MFRPIGALAHLAYNVGPEVQAGTVLLQDDEEVLGSVNCFSISFGFREFILPYTSVVTASAQASCLKMVWRLCKQQLLVKTVGPCRSLLGLAAVPVCMPRLLAMPWNGMTNGALQIQPLFICWAHPGHGRADHVRSSSPGPCDQSYEQKLMVAFTG